MTDRKINRHWCGKANFDGLSPFVVGNVVAETELEAERKMFDLWAKIMPYDPPKVFTMMPGYLLFNEYGE